MGSLIEEIHEAVLNGTANLAKEKTIQALASGEKAEVILNQGLINAMKEVGKLFEEEEYFVPEMLISARAMQSALTILKPALVAQDIKSKGKIVIGTVQGDLHDIGKNLVSMMLEGAGFQIVDLGTDISAEAFLEAVHMHKPDIVAMSALLTTTMANIPKTIQLIKEKGAQAGLKIIIGGAPVTQRFADEAGADGFASDANQAVVMATKIMENVA
mgnify:FL=1